MNKKIPIQFHFINHCTLENRQRLKKFIITIFKKEKRAFNTMSLIFCDDKHLLSLNRQFLQHDFYTDILSFPLSNAGEPLVAEIYISTDRVRENAMVYGSTFKDEIHRVIFHGVLHFCGYKDKSKKDLALIRKMENKYLKKYLSLSQ